MALSKAKAAKLAARLQEVVVLDSGCSQSTCCNQALFTDLRPYNGQLIYGIGEKTINPELQGTANIHVMIDGKSKLVKVSDTICCPDLTCNLPSVSQLTRKGAEFLFWNKTAFGAREEKVFLIAFETNSLYIVDQKNNIFNIAGLNIQLHGPRGSSFRGVV